VQRDEWERCEDPRQLLSAVGEAGDHPDRGIYGAVPHRASDRKFLLVAAAVLRKVASTADLKMRPMIGNVAVNAEGWAETGKRPDSHENTRETPEEYTHTCLQWVDRHRGWRTLPYSLMPRQCGIIRDIINPWAKTTWLICHVCNGNRVLTSEMVMWLEMTGGTPVPCMMCEGSGVNPSFPRPSWVTSLVLDLGWQAYHQRERICTRCKGTGKIAPQYGLINPGVCGKCKGKGVYDPGTIYPERLMVLGDAVEEAGCDREDVMAHLRSPGPHYRGMWSLDQVPGLR
jgi:hypothetical protein